MPLRPYRPIFALLVGLAGGLRAADAPATVIAVQVRGTVEVQHDQSTATEAVTEGAQLVTADTVTTAAKSSVMLVLPNGSVVALKERSRLKIALALHSPAATEALAANETEPREAGTSQTNFELAFGQMLTRVRKLNPSSTFTVQTPVSVAAVRGTVFEVSYQTDAKGGARYNLSTSSGLVHVTPHAGKMVAVPGNEQVDFAAEIGQGGIKIKNLKASKLAKRKQQQIDKEAADNDHAAGEFLRRTQPAGAAAKAKAAAAGHADAGNASADRTANPATSANSAAKPATPATGSTPATPGANASTNRTTTPATPAVTPPAAKPTTPAVKPPTTPVKPKTLPKPVKRPPRRP